MELDVGSIWFGKRTIRQQHTLLYNDIYLVLYLFFYAPAAYVIAQCPFIQYIYHINETDM
jgi:hypothetical protein